MGFEISRMLPLLQGIFLCCLSFRNYFSMYCINIECHFLFSVAFSKLRQDSVHWEGMQRSFLWPKCLSGANTILGFPQAVCMIPEGADQKDFKGISGPEEEMKSSPLPLALCVHQPGDLQARLTGNSRCIREGSISKYSWNLYSKDSSKKLRLWQATGRQP